MSLKKNILANLGGKILTLAIGFVTVPIYIRFLGIESYGLIAFYAILFATVYLFEFGLSVTVNREIAKKIHIIEEVDNTRDLVRSFEIIYWCIGLVLAIVIFLFSPLIAAEWLRNEHIENKLVANSIALMGGVIAFQWPVSLYSGGLMGLERQVLLNVLLSGFSTLRAIGSVLVLWLLSPTLMAFFIWQLIAAVVYVIIVSVTFWKVVPDGTRSPQFSLQALKKIWRFTVGVGATGIVTFLLSNIDKIVLSNLLTLTDFGHYNIANQFNMATRISSGAVFQAIFPRFSKLYASKDSEEIIRLYHEGSQFISLIVFPVSITFSFFSYEILYVWLQNKGVAESSAIVSSILIVGSAFNAALGVPYDMTVAYGWSMFGFYQNIISALIIAPLMLFLISVYGVIGAALSWFLLNLGYLLISAPIMAKKMLPRGELVNWYLNDIGRPFLVCILIVGFFRWIFSLHTQFLSIFVIWITAQLFCLASLSLMRKRVKILQLILLNKYREKFS